MNTIYEENNHITLMGKVTSEKRFSHEIYGEKFYIFDISVPRLSGSSDIIPLYIYFVYIKCYIFLFFHKIFHFYNLPFTAKTL